MICDAFFPNFAKSPQSPLFIYLTITRLDEHNSSVLFLSLRENISVSIVVSIPVCHTGDRGSIPRQRVIFAEDKRKVSIEQIEANVELQSST